MNKYPEIMQKKRIKDVMQTTINEVSSLYPREFMKGNSSKIINKTINKFIKFTKVFV